MDINEHVAPSGQHYSGRNRVPNVQEFMEQLDTEKRERDATIDAALKKNRPSKEAKDHENAEMPGRKDSKTVRDPVTARDVDICDAQMDFGEVEKPQLSIPNENLGKPTTVTVSSRQSGEEYRRAQDITAPPDPVQEGATSDVPIRSEKTSVLFYKTPSVSYEPTFAALERKAHVLCLGILMAIIIVGKSLGGKLLGLIPLAVCISAAVFLWVKDLIRQGRDLEWSSEQPRSTSYRSLSSG